MKARLPALCISCLTAFALSAKSMCGQTVITFDDFSFPTNNEMTFIPNGYHGLNWSNFGVVNVLSNIAEFGTNGSYYGMVTPPNVAFNGSGNPAEIDAVGTNFNFLSAYLTGIWNNDLSVEVEGFNGTNLLYDQTVIASATNATLFTFDYLGIDRLYFNSYGGEPAGYPSGIGEVFAMDNFTFEFIPEPSALLLTALGAVPLCVFLRRKRR